MHNDLIDLLNRLSNEIDNLRTILHSGYDIGRGVDRGACSAPTDKAQADIVRCYRVGDRLTHPSLHMTREQAIKGGYTIAGPAHGYIDQATERDQLIAQAFADIGPMSKETAESLSRGLAQYAAGDVVTVSDKGIEE